MCKVLLTEISNHQFQGSAKQFSSTGRNRASSFLSLNLAGVTDSYAMCLVSYALSLAKSASSGVAYDLMMAMAREEGGMVYWGRTKIKTNR